MAIIEVNCPACGKTLQFEDTKEKGFCEFCGEQIFLKDSAAAPSPLILITAIPPLPKGVEIADIMSFSKYSISNYFHLHGGRL